MNQVFISGRLTKDPELQQSKGGKLYARVSVAVDRGYSREEKKRREDAGEQTADFFNVVLFGQTADFLTWNGSRGARVIVSGRMEFSNYMREDGERSTYAQVVAYNVELIDWRDHAAEPAEDYTPVNDERVPF
uniref:single-stranded DNA-binding protein n=1 Tax=Ndongobacter massiliensis TaxID=1871025 RepID=UPI00093000B2|nr:single-stranded DNA-binding protein [Ndongobacter massiliensis]